MLSASPRTSAAARCPSATADAYVFRRTEGSWPSIAATSATEARPDDSRVVDAKCRPTCMPLSGMSAWVAHADQTRGTFRGSATAPISFVVTYPLSVQADPSANCSMTCRLRWAFIFSITCLGSGTRRLPRRVLGSPRCSPADERVMLPTMWRTPVSRSTSVHSRPRIPPRRSPAASANQATTSHR
jgi:hypothetical protein